MASTYLTRTFGSSTNRKKCTISFWVKKGFSGDTQQPFCSYANNDNRYQIYFESTDELSVYNKDNGSDTIYYKTNAKYRDPNAWYHVYVGVDLTLSTASDRVQIYVNGERITSFASSTVPNINTDLSFGNNAFVFNLGRYGGTGHHVNGVLSHFYLVDGSLIAHTEFGSTDSTTGEWKINTQPTISDFGNQGCKLFIDDNSVNDQSGKGNNMTLAGGTLTPTQDNPSNVFATMNPLNVPTSNAPSFSNGNTTSISSSSGSGKWGGSSTLGMTSGKFYCEAKATVDGTYSRNVIGITGSATDVARTNATILSNTGNSSGYYSENGQVNYNNSQQYTGAVYGTGDIVQIAIDLDNNRLFYGKNGVWNNSGDPTSSTGAITIAAASDCPDGAYFFAQNDDTGTSAQSKFEWNFGNGYFGTTAVSSAGTNASNLGIFEYDVPTGYTALCTKGLNE